MFKGLRRECCIWLMAVLVVVLMGGCTTSKQINTTPGVTATVEVTPAATAVETPASQEVASTVTSTDQPITTSPASAKKITMAEIKTGMTYLNTSLMAINAGLKIVKAQYPDKYVTLNQKVQPIMQEIGDWVAKIKLAYDAADPELAVSFYNLARPQLGNIMEAFQDVAGNYISNLLFNH